MKRTITGAVALLVCVVLPLRADEPEEKPDFAALSKLLHQLAVKRLPKEVEDQSHWGSTIPVPPNLPLPRLRTYLKTPGGVAVPHGAWRRFKGRIEEPDRNLKITVRDFRPLDDKTYRLTLDADAWIHAAGEWQQWQKGLMLIGAQGEADAHLVIGVVCDVGVAFDFTRFPPTVKLDPVVQDLAVDLRELRFPRDPNAPPDDPRGTKLEDRLRDVLREVLRAAEPQLKEEANRILAEALRDGRGKLSAADLLRVVPQTAPKKRLADD